jgi:hypothetical protein
LEKLLSFRDRNQLRLRYLLLIRSVIVAKRWRYVQVRTQHADRCVDFLARELRVCTPKEAEERIFFISAKEALLTRMREREKPVSCK